MKKTIFSAIIMALVLVSCKDKEPTIAPSHKMDNGNTMMDNDTTMMKNDKMMEDKMYTCPMHSEVHGKLNDKCSKCGMKLTEPIPEKK